MLNVTRWLLSKSRKMISIMLSSRVHFRALRVLTLRACNTDANADETLSLQLPQLQLLYNYK